MADKHSDRTAAGEGFEIDLDDTFSSWEEVAEEAVAAVEKSQEGSGGREADAAEDTAPEDAAEDTAPGVIVFPADENLAGAEGEVKANGEDSEGRQLHDRLVRTLADFDNYRKRAEREKEKIKRYALFDVLKDFLDVFDNLERALAASGSAEDLKAGVQMIVRQFTDLLGRHGVEAFDAVGQPFDPTVHEAVMREAPSEEISVPTVSSEFQRGYKLRERLLRPAMVGVSMPQSKPDEEAQALDEDAEAVDTAAASADAATDDGESSDRRDDNEIAAASTEAQ